jgi:hypothetical protein
LLVVFHTTISWGANFLVDGESNDSCPNEGSFETVIVR